MRHARSREVEEWLHSDKVTELEFKDGQSSHRAHLLHHYTVYTITFFFLLLLIKLVSEGKIFHDGNYSPPQHTEGQQLTDMNTEWAPLRTPGGL